MALLFNLLDSLAGRGMFFALYLFADGQRGPTRKSSVLAELHEDRTQYDPMKFEPVQVRSSACLS